MGMSASQARLLSMTARLADLELRGQQIANAKIRLGNDSDTISQKYLETLQNTHMYTTTEEGQKQQISYQNLLAQGLYLLNVEDNSVLGYGEKQVVIGQETYLSGYEDDLTKPLTFEQMTVAGPTIHHDAEYVQATQQTTFMEPDNTLSPIASESVDAMKNMVASTGLGENDLKVVSYQTEVNGQMKTINAVSINSQAGFDAMMAKLQTEDSTALKQNYVLNMNTSTVDMSGKNWNPIGSSAVGFQGLFDGNMTTISNVNIDGANGVNNQGFFGKIAESGKVKNLALDGVTVNVNNSALVAGFAGENNGSVTNCSASNVKINVSGSGYASSGAYGAGPTATGGFIGGNTGTVDRCYVTGSGSAVKNVGTSSATKSSNAADYDLVFSSSANVDGVGGFIGCNGSTASNVSRSYSTMNIYTNGGTECCGTFLGCDATNGSIEDSYCTGVWNKTIGQSSTFFGHDNSKVSNCYSLSNNNPSTYQYWNENGANTRATSLDISNWDQKFTDTTKTWDTTGSVPELNSEVMNLVLVPEYDEVTTIEVDNTQKPLTYAQKEVYSERDVYAPALDMKSYNSDDLSNWSSDRIEEALRTGKIVLAKEADEYSSNSTKVGNFDFEILNYESSPAITEELYKEDDAVAEAEYNAKMTKINNKEKIFDMELNKIDTEHNALQTEYDSVKKVIEKNIERTFKLFG